MKREKRFIAAPYMFVMVIGFIIVSIGAYTCMLVACDLTLVTMWRYPGGKEVIILLFSLYLVLLITFFCIRYEWATIVEIQEDWLLFKALFTRRSFYYKDMHYIGVDYGVLQGSKQFWSYFSEKEIPMKYYHRINRLKFKKDCMRVQYYKKAYNKLVEHTPPEISKQLRKCYSTVLLYKLDDED